jgi:hypothetical protein
MVNRPDPIKVEINIDLITRGLPHLDELRKRMSGARVYERSERIALDVSSFCGTTDCAWIGFTFALTPSDSPRKP